MKIIKLRNPPAWYLLISSLFIGLWSLYSYISGEFIFGNKYHAHVTVVYRSKDPEEFLMWLRLATISSVVLSILAFVEIVPLDNMRAILSSRIGDRRDAMLLKSPPWWAYIFWGFVLLLTLYLLYYGITLKQK